MLYTHTPRANTEQKKKDYPKKIGRPPKKSAVEEEKRKEVQYHLNTAKAIQLIWRSAFLTKHLGI
jgi:hypothetical protein